MATITTLGLCLVLSNVLFVVNAGSYWLTIQEQMNTSSISNVTASSTPFQTDALFVNYTRLDIARSRVQELQLEIATKKSRITTDNYTLSAARLKLSMLTEQLTSVKESIASLQALNDQLERTVTKTETEALVGK